MTVLKELIEHPVEQEENEMFDRADNWRTRWSRKSANG